MSARILWQMQLSAYGPDGKFILTTDSNWQMMVTKAMHMRKIDPNIMINVLTPMLDQCAENPYTLLQRAGVITNVNPIFVRVEPNALVTRYDFPWKNIHDVVKSTDPAAYTHVYVNDPMQVRNYVTLFHIFKHRPKFIVQTHFLDSPISRVVPEEVSYWQGIVEGNTKADHCLWMCDASRDVFEKAARIDYMPHIVDAILAKSMNWKDGYSEEEMRAPIDQHRIR
jgi:hypothetical protein